MPIRTQLLMAFVGVTLLALVIFGMVAYWLLPDAVRSQEASMLKGLSQRVGARLRAPLARGDVDGAALSRLRERLVGPDTFIVLLDSRQRVLGSSQLTATDDDQAVHPERILAAVQALPSDAKTDQGVLDFARRQYAWARSPIPGSSDVVTLLHPLSLDYMRFGSTLWMRLLATALFVMWVAVWAALLLSSIIARRLNEKNAALSYQAHHDGLTGLPNRGMLNEHLNELTVRARQNGQTVGLFVMDLNRFKEINDTLGHPFGDQLLKMVGMRVRGILRENDLIARLGGDEFAVVLPGAGRKDAVSCAMRIVHVLERAFSIDGLNLHIKTSLGIAIYPEDGDAADLLIQHADTAMYKAKKSGADYRFYDSADDPYSVRRLTLTSDLRTAIERDQLLLHYQPKIHLASGQVSGVEALVRWQHPEHGFMPPDEFIPLAEQTGLIGALTDWVLNEAIRQCGVWGREGRDLRVAVNLSAHSLKNPHLPADIAGMLDAWGVAPQRLVLEITESAMMEDHELAADIVHRLDQMGIAIAIDDFGTGFSSLAYLQRLPVHEIKIDKSFVIGMDGAENESNAVIVRSIVDLAHNIGCKVVAEGVENDAVLGRLRAFGVDIAQGYHFSRPLAVEALVHWLASSGRSNAEEYESTSPPLISAISRA
ncbi:MAG TPA: EAL domain-containing protein [Gammaproteobacteria bacterium]|nr:EAL domain-containing protein [Gammaproteobacteria bacterium]